MPSEETPSFNLWYEPWITLEDAQGHSQRCGIEQTLLQAHRYTTITELSPLVIVGIRRLLTAILQAIFQPRRMRDLRDLLQQAAFPREPILQFGKRYAARFDLFSPDLPFLQSADLPLQPRKGDKNKTAAHLAPEIPTGTESIHFRHGSDAAYVLCPICVAGCLCALPAFATTGGQSFRPSINGVPPIYVLPEGQNLFESCVYSLLLPDYQPRTRSQTQDLVWWERQPPIIIGRDQEVLEVGYLHSLTFPARRVRLHPERMGDGTRCSRCGNAATWGVRTMIFEMGECRPKDAPIWLDPFAAYLIPTGTRRNAQPRPLRPRPNHALWREYASLFLAHSQTSHQPGAAEQSHRPRVLDQLAELTEQSDDAGPLYTFRCVGLRTDMKAKIFEWVEAGFEVPLTLLGDPSGGDLVSAAVRFAEQCAKIILDGFDRFMRGNASRRNRNASLRAGMEERFWTALATPFRQLVLRLADAAQRREAQAQWAARCVREAAEAFRFAAASIGDDAAALQKCVEGEVYVTRRLNNLRKEQMPDE